MQAGVRASLATVSLQDGPRDAVPAVVVHECGRQREAGGRMSHAPHALGGWHDVRKEKCTPENLCLYQRTISDRVLLYTVVPAWSVCSQASARGRGRRLERLEGVWRMFTHVRRRGQEVVTQVQQSATATRRSLLSRRQRPLHVVQHAALQRDGSGHVSG